MKIILLFLAAPVSFIIYTQPPSQTVEQAIRHIYQSYKSDTTAPYFSETKERAITSARIQQALTLNDNLTLPGNVGQLDHDPICDCQDSGDLVLGSVAITQTDADHTDAIVRFCIFQDSKERTSQTLKMVAENGRWVVSDIVGNHNSALQAVDSENEKTLAAITSLRREQPEAFVAEPSEHIADYSQPQTWVVSGSYRRAVSAFRKTTFKAANNSDEDMPIERQSIYDNPICFGEKPLFSHVDEIRVLGKTTDSARIHVRLTLTDGSNEEQELILQWCEGKWEIADFIRPNSGNLLKQVEAKTAARLKR